MFFILYFSKAENYHKLKLMIYWIVSKNQLLWYTLHFSYFYKKPGHLQHPAANIFIAQKLTLFEILKVDQKNNRSKEMNYQKRKHERRIIKTYFLPGFCFVINVLYNGILIKWGYNCVIIPPY